MKKQLLREEQYNVRNGKFKFRNLWAVKFKIKVNDCTTAVEDMIVLWYA